jgi:hypothetical protein
MSLNPIEIGDMLSISRPGYKHVGIYVGQHGLDGSCVVHNCKGKGVILSNLDDFSGNSPIFIHQKAIGSFIERQTIVHRALSLLGTNYDLFQFNCEHAASFAQSGVARSPQIVGASLLALFAIGGLALLAGKKA